MRIDSTWVAMALAVFSVLLVPTLALLTRVVARWTRTEDKLGQLMSDVGELVASKDQVHAAMLEQMRADREATDKRLRFLEEFFMRRGWRFRG